jgi:hypothetical protein
MRDHLILRNRTSSCILSLTLTLAAPVGASSGSRFLSSLLQLMNALVRIVSRRLRLRAERCMVNVWHD